MKKVICMFSDDDQSMEELSSPDSPTAEHAVNYDETPDLDAIEADFEITERTDEIEQFTIEYISQLMGIEECFVTDLIDCSCITAFVDNVEKFLWDEFGLGIYRP